VKLPVWFRVGWWALLLVGTGAYLASRLYAIESSNSTPFDLSVLAIFAALALAPLFSELSLGGFTFKQHLEEAKDELKREVTQIRSDLLTAIQFSSTTSQSVTLAPPPDQSLPAIKASVEEVLRRLSAGPPTPLRPLSPIPADVADLFAVRFGLDREVRRIAALRGLERSAAGFEGHRSTLGLVRRLDEAGLIPPKIAIGIRDVYLICSRATHGEPVTSDQAAFAKSLGTELVTALTNVA